MLSRLVFVMVLATACAGCTDDISKPSEPLATSEQFWFVNSKTCKEPFQREEVLNWTYQPPLPVVASSAIAFEVPTYTQIVQYNTTKEGFGALSVHNLTVTNADDEIVYWNDPINSPLEQGKLFTMDEDVEPGPHTFYWESKGNPVFMQFTALAYICTAGPFVFAD